MDSSLGQEQRKVPTMASRNAMNAADKKLLDNLQSDLRQLSNEAKRKFPAVKEVCDHLADG